MSRRAASGLLIAVFAAVACAGAALTATRASAVFHELAETGRPGYLKLALHSGTPLWAELEPGDSMRWLVEASLHGSDSGTLAVELQAGGDLVSDSGMTAEVETCSVAFDITASPVGCEGSRATVLPPTPLAQIPQQGHRRDLADVSSGTPRQVLVTLAIPATTPAAGIEGRSARIGLGVHASGDAPATGLLPLGTPRSPRALAATGSDVLALGLLSVGLVGVGAAAALRRRAPAAHGGRR
ncbi:hypothetical protein H490_0114850 [Leucobacter sp. UCD-THU]|uniref:hypothetical protein n=1 Tax=Leucobacter sp. UCD-THU TaxID=1292023 RepID=UPI000381BECA|nr:hypothetical protein [Leucobacter sp. UCD-THU]EYT51858.1 hypothetical protein H490_0114850 [Leucobacter sp. UCD-THU]